MKSWYRVISLLLHREIFPAPDGAAGWRRGGLYNLVVSYLPTIGILLILFVISLFGLYLVVQNQKLASRLDALKDSPHLALFSKAHYSVAAPPGSNKNEENNFNDLNRWRQMTYKEFLSLTDPTNPLLHGTSNDRLLKMPLFGNIYPFSYIRLTLRKKDGNHLERTGMGLMFNGEESDKSLLKEIQKNSESENGWKIPQMGETDGIVVLRKTLSGLDRERSDPMKSLWGHDAYRYGETKDIPLKVLTVLKKFPYQVDFIVSMEQLVKLKTTHYYRDSVTTIDIQYSDGRTSLDEKEKTFLKTQLPQKDQISVDLITVGDNKVFRVTLGQTLSWSDIFEKLKVGESEERIIKTTLSDAERRQFNHSGGIFYLNPEIVKNEAIVLEDFLKKLQNFMDSKDIEVPEGLLNALQESFQDQREFEKMRRLFLGGSIAMLGILLIFFSIVLHTRLNRLGILRMLGVPKYSFMVVYGLSACIFAIIAFLVANLVLFFALPKETIFSLYTDAIYLTLSLIGGMFFVAMLGVLLPTAYFMAFTQPAEMMARRN